MKGSSIRDALRRAASAPLTVALFILSAASPTSQTRIRPPDNRYTPAQDVELGRKAAMDVEEKLPIMRDDAVSSYVEEVGNRLVTAIPPEFQHPEFRYSFRAVDVKEINAFAL